MNILTASYIFIKTHPKQYISNEYITSTVVTSPVHVGSKAYCKNNICI